MMIAILTGSCPRQSKFDNRDVMNMKRLGYLGPPGTFTQLAAEELISRLDNYSRISCQEIPDLIQAVDRREIDLAVVPIENSLEGSVNVTLDYLAHKVSLQIVGEIILPINQQLIAGKGITISDIEEIYSHPQALAQCRDYLQKLSDSCQICRVSSTAEAVELVSRGQEDSATVRAAIGSRLAARLNQLEIIAADIQDNDSNWTRFVVLSRSEDSRLEELISSESAEEKENYKTSIICSPIKNRPGILHEMLAEFASRNINLTRIESRPTRKMLGDYLFFIDFTGHLEQPQIKEIITGLKQKTSHLKILGSYSRLSAGLEQEDLEEGRTHEINQFA